MFQKIIAKILTPIAVLLFSLLPSQPSVQTPIAKVGSTAPQATALVDTYLTANIGSTDVSMTLASGVDKEGNSLSGKYCFTIDVNTPTVEYVCGTATGANITALTRGVSVSNPNIGNTALAYSHRRFASVTNTDYPTLQALVRMVNGVDGFDSPLYYQIAPTFSSSTQLVDKAYSDSGTNQGAATSTETNGGIVELGTLAEQASSFDGGVAKPTVLQTKNSTSTCQVVGSYNIVASTTTGKLDKGCFDQTAQYTLTGTTTITNKISIAASGTSTNPLVLNGLPYAFNPSSVASSTIPKNDGTGYISFENPDWQLLGDVSLGGLTTGTTTFSSRKNYLVIINSQGLTAAGFPTIRFNGIGAANQYHSRFREGWGTADLFDGGTYGMTLSGVTGTGTTTPEFFTIKIMNVSTLSKQVEWTGSAFSGGATTPPMGLLGTGVWTNTSNAIVNITVSADKVSDGSPDTYSAGSAFQVYGSKN